ncbi:MAG: serine/threonine-protein kinase [Pseudomonadota bacterium]
MDWRKVSKDIEALDALPKAERDSRLSESGHDAESQFVTGYFERRRRAESFMLTAVGDSADLDAELLPIGTTVGSWKIERFIAAGGMGEVYEASRQDELYEQRVALKILRTSSPEWHRKFASERQRLATLDHPGISRIIDGGQSDDSRPYMAIELVEGEPIDQHVANRQLPRREILLLGLQLCDAVGHAHSRLILHRDIKPANVLIDATGNVRLIDFGVSSLIKPENSHEVGPLTIAYAAPEQLNAETPSIATDIFSIGLVLHQNLVGHLPARASDGSVEIQPNDIGSVDLFAILAKAIAYDPAERYNTVNALRQDLANLIDRRPVAARNGNSLYRFSKALQRNPGIFALGGGLTVALLVGYASTFIANQREQASRQRAEFFLAKAEDNVALQSTYRDILDRAFTTEADSARVREVMLARAQDALDNYQKDPDKAAQICLVVGGHFVDAFDYDTARGVLEPWITAGFGSEGLLRTGKMRLADVFTAVGETEKGLALLREIAPSFDDPNRYLSDEHLSFAFELAYATSDPQDSSNARRLMEIAIAEDRGDDPDRLFGALHYLQYLQKDAGEFRTAHETMKRAAALYESSALRDHSQWGITQIYLAAYEFYVDRDFTQAEQRVDELITWSDENGSPDDQAYRFKAELAAERGDFSVARDTMDRSAEIEAQYFGSAFFSVFGDIELRAQMGDFEGARAGVAAFAEARASESSEPSYHVRFALAAAYVEALAGDLEGAAAQLERFGFSVERAKSDPARMYRVERLREMGVRF